MNIHSFIYYMCKFSGKKIKKVITKIFYLVSRKELIVIIRLLLVLVNFYLYCFCGQIFLPTHNVLYDKTGRYGTSAV